MKKVVFVSTLLLCSLSIFGQTQDTVKHNPPRIGFNVGLNYSQVFAHDGLPTNASISNGLGMRIGLIGEYKISDIFSFSPKLELSFNNSKVLFSTSSDSPDKYEIMPAGIELMTHFIIKKKSQSLRPYFIFGPNIKIPLPKTTSNTTSYSTGTDIALDLGIGIDKSLEKFNFSPELRYSFGLQNVNTNPAVQSLSLHNISLIFNFLGKARKQYQKLPVKVYPY